MVQAQNNKNIFTNTALKTALESIDAKDLLKHTTILASDPYEGRAPGSKGEELSVAYISSQFKNLGLKPGNPDGSYFQNVPLFGYRSETSASINIAGQDILLKFPENYIATSRLYQPEVKVENSEMVFVGYGIIAPEYGWDDYKGIDVKGKTIVMLVNDPPVTDPMDDTKLDTNIFKGKAMTYYGRWTYKYEIASRLGAAAAIIIHETGPAGYPFEVVTSSGGHENFDIKKGGTQANHVPVESWISSQLAVELFNQNGMDFQQLKRTAATGNFKPVPMNGKANFHIKNTLRDVSSKNVIAKMEGSDKNLKDQYIIYSAHWDHLGKDTALKGDQIYNGALDNASGVAGLLELAQAFSKVKPKRTILFMAVTAEEEGLLGSRYYCENPLYPIKNTLANINMDGINPFGRTSDIIVVGKGQSSLEDILKLAANSIGRTTRPEDTPEKGSYYRSDHFSFAKVGIPALYTRSGIEFIGKPEGYGKALVENYIATNYHKVSDEVESDWDFSGGVDDLRLFFHVGNFVSEQSTFPYWKEGSEFKAVREK